MGRRPRRDPTGNGASRANGPRELRADELAWRCPARLVRGAIAAEEKARREEERGRSDEERARLALERRLSERPQVALDEIVGQERAIEALAAGLQLEAPAFHLFVCAPHGTGRTALVQGGLRRFRPPLPPACDLVYVADFARPERPRLLTLPRGRAREFRRDLDEALAVLKRAIPAALGHEHHTARMERIRRRAESEALRLLEAVGLELRSRGLVLGQVPEGFGTPELRVDVGDLGEPLPPRVVRARLKTKELRRSRRLEAALAAWPAGREQVEQVATSARELVRQAALRVKRLEARIARSIARGFTSDLARAYPSRPIREWLATLLEAIGEKVELFFEQSRREEERERDGGERRLDQDALAPFRVNLFVDAAARPEHPVLFEPNPTLANLFGMFDPGEGLADHQRLRAGSLAQANGGVIVVDALELWNDAQAWRAFVRAVTSGWIELPTPGGQAPGSALRPEPIRTGFKLIAIGTDRQWEQMLDEDPTFAEVFKVKVQLEDRIDRTDANVGAGAAALLRLSRRAGLLRPDAGALARLLEHSTRLAGRRDKLSAGFSELLDVMQEADRVARDRGRGVRSVARDDVEAAIARRRRRHDLHERRVQEDLLEGAVRVETDGARAGAVNALTVYDTGDHLFARPMRISATVGAGKRGVVDVERESGLSGDLHTKGVQVLSGLLRGLYAQDHPLGFTATICFEQSHGPVDGDSASAAETIALISALTGLPARQDLAITGAVTQHGELVSIGAPTAKVEGFFAVCQARGLTGRQGVLIPSTSAGELVLSAPVLEAVEAGTFRVIALETLDQALELLLSTPAGTREAPGAPWTPGSVHARAQAAVRELYLASRPPRHPAEKRLPRSRSRS